MMIISGTLATLFTLMGLIFSYLYNLTSGASIILVPAVFLVGFLVADRMKSRAGN